LDVGCWPPTISQGTPDRLHPSLTTLRCLLTLFQPVALLLQLRIRKLLFSQIGSACIQR